MISDNHLNKKKLKPFHVCCSIQTKKKNSCVIRSEQIKRHITKDDVMGVCVCDVCDGVYVNYNE